MKISVLLFLLIFSSYFGYSGILKKQIPRRTIVLTFDDATASHFSVAAPLLKKYGFGATFFVCEFPPHFNDTTKYMNWRQVRELDRMGFEIANHTRNHPAIARLNEDQIKEQVQYIEQKCDSMKIRKPLSFAYPGYSLSAEVMKILQEKGYQFARAGGNHAYNPLTDHPLLVPSWAMNSENMQQMTEILNEARDGKIVVLTIHGVPDLEHPWVNTTPELFEKYLDYLHKNHYKVIALRDLIKYIRVNEAMNTITPDLTQKIKY